LDNDDDDDMMFDFGRLDVIATHRERERERERERLLVVLLSFVEYCREPPPPVSVQQSRLETAQPPTVIVSLQCE